jgi:hypothetical protein
MLRERTERRDLLSESGRITPREVLEAYWETGLEPMVDDFGDEKGRACALAALAAQDFGRGFAGPEEAETLVDEYRAKRFEVGEVESYTLGFMRGFDGVRCRPPGKSSQHTVRALEARERQGWRDGHRARRFCLPGHDPRASA